ncbi:probable WRKY transcription factor 53 isoform X1 [Cucurbita moschata]|uniref:Probable WRKY transcription factor 53 isoform X1 n=1 Tax=Cucurbita moschata TaxID=3662 RepID=A0A6J1E4E2_CUCMO|nr:probable WRKY transcription factor 53 isoform X1 [Cucurbita moschata]XP_022922780.1 probable WRKY transcription factor 53 isoform X1 [Cucurbita moschata]
MDSFGEWDQKKKLKNELLKGKELAKQLQIHLNVRPSSSSMAAAAAAAAAVSSSSSSSVSNDGGELLVQKILSSYEKALSLLSSNGIQISESPSSLNGSPRSEDSDREFKDHDHTNASSRTRNILPTWTQKFQVSPGMALEGSLDDGFCWRKYGQKGILGARHPRGYYRCTHRNLQGCLATKQVQRSDHDPNIFEITYRGTHSCTQVIPSASTEFQQQNHPLLPDQRVQNQQTSPDALLSSWPSLRVITENLDTIHDPTLFHPFNYDPTSNYEVADRVESGSTLRANVNFSEFSPPPPFLSPTTSGSGLSYFSASSSGLSEGFIGHHQKLDLQPNKSELSEIFSSPTSASNSATPGLDFPFGELQMEPTFTFHNTNFFS